MRKPWRIRKLSGYLVVSGIIALIMAASMIPFSMGATGNINPDSRSVTWGSEPLGWDPAWLTTDDDQFYKVYRGTVNFQDIENLDPLEYEMITGSLAFGGLSDLATYNDVYMGFNPQDNSVSETNSYDNASSSTLIYGSQTVGTYLDTFEDDDTVHTILETDQGSAGSNVENNVDNNGSDVDGSGDKGTENNFSNAQSDPTGSYMDLTEANQAGEGGSEWLSVTDWDETYDGWDTKVGADPWVNAQDEPTNVISEVASGDVIVGWFTFPSTTLTGTLTVNISVYCRNEDGAGDDWADVYVDYTGGAGSDIGDVGQHTGWQYDTLAVGSLSVAEVNALKIYFQYKKSGGGDDVYLDHVRIGVSAEAGDDYEIDFEYQWTTLNPLDDTNEELCIYVQATFPTENLLVKIRDSSSWIQIDTLDGTGWFNVSISGYLDNAQETIQLIGASEEGEGTQDTWNIGYIGIHTWTDPANDYQLSVFYTINIPDETLDNYYVNISCSRTSGGDNFDIDADSLSVGTISSTSETYFTLDITSQVSDNVVYLKINDTLADDGSAQSISVDWLRVWGYSVGSSDYDFEVIFGFDSAQAEADIINIELDDQSNCTTGGNILVQIENHTETSWHTIFNVDSDTETDHYWNGSTYNDPTDILNTTSGFRIRYYYQNAGSQYNLTIDRLNASITYQYYEYRIQVLLNFTFTPNFDGIQGFNVSDRSYTGAGTVSATIYNFTGSSWDPLYSVNELTETAHGKIAGAVDDYISGADLITVRYLGSQGVTDYGNLTLDLLEIAIEYTVSDDSDPPVITLDAPVNNTWSYVNQINLSITDTTGVHQAYYRLSNYTPDLSGWIVLGDPYDIDVSQLDEGVYRLWVIANDTVGNPSDIFNNMENYTIIKGDLMPPINIFEEIFYSTELWGLTGPLIIIGVGFWIMRKNYKVGLMYSVPVFFAVGTYFDRFLVNPAYAWHFTILLFGWLLVCIYPFFDR